MPEALGMARRAPYVKVKCSHPFNIFDARTRATMIQYRAKMHKCPTTTCMQQRRRQQIYFHSTPKAHRLSIHKTSKHESRVVSRVGRRRWFECTRAQYTIVEGEIACGRCHHSPANLLLYRLSTVSIESLPRSGGMAPACVSSECFQCLTCITLKAVHQCEMNSDIARVIGP